VSGQTNPSGPTESHPTAMHQQATGRHDEDTKCLRPGHDLTWGRITRGTILEGVPYDWRLSL